MNKKNNGNGIGNNSKSDLLEESLINPSRRNLLKGAGLVGAAAVSTIATSHVIAADSTNTNSNSNAPREALEALTAEEAETLAAICDCLIPSDEHGPGAREARAVHYIDKSLASHNSGARHNYSVGLNAINEFARQTRGKFFFRVATRSAEFDFARFTGQQDFGFYSKWQWLLQYASRPYDRRHFL